MVFQFSISLAKINLIIDASAHNIGEVNMNEIFKMMLFRYLKYLSKEGI